MQRRWHVHIEEDGPRERVSARVGLEFGNAAVPIPEVHPNGDIELPQVIHTDGALGGVSSALQGGHEQGRENGDDGDYDQQFDEGEPAGTRTLAKRFWMLVIHNPAFRILSM